MSESIENTYAQTLNAILDYVTGEQQVSAAPIKLVINKTFELVEESKKWNTRAEYNPLNWDECVKLAAKLQIISITLMAERKLNNDAKTVDEWLKEAIPIEQKLYAEAIQAALPSKTAKGKEVKGFKTATKGTSWYEDRIKELETELSGITGGLAALQAKVSAIPTNTDRENELETLIIEMQEIIDAQEKQIKEWREALEDVEKQFAAYEKDGNRYSEASIYLKISKVRQALAKYPAKQKE